MEQFMNSAEKQLAFQIQEAVKVNKLGQALALFENTPLKNKAILIQASLKEFRENEIKGIAQENVLHSIRDRILQLAEDLGDNSNKRTQDLGSLHHLYCDRVDHSEHFKQDYQEALDKRSPFLFCTLYGPPQQSHKGLIKRLLHQYVQEAKDEKVKPESIVLPRNYTFSSLKGHFLDELWKRSNKLRPNEEEKVSILPLLQALEERGKKVWAFRIYIKSSYWDPILVTFLQWFINEYCQDPLQIKSIQQSRIKLCFFFTVVYEEVSDNRGLLKRWVKKTSPQRQLEQEIVGAMKTLTIPHYTCLPELYAVEYDMLDDWMETYVSEFSHTRKSALLTQFFPEGKKKRYAMERVEQQLKAIVSLYNEEFLLQSNP